MQYISTRGSAPVLSFEEAMLAGLARDGGLYVPQTDPQFTPAEIAALRGASYEAVAHAVMRPFIGDCFDDSELREIIDRAYAGFGHPARCPLVQTGTNDWILELHHGPTLAFKDVALQLIGQMFDRVLGRRGERVTIVGATSGRHRLGGDGGVSRLGSRRCFLPAPGGPHLRCSAPADDHAARRQRSRHRRRRHLRRLPGPR